MPRDDTRTFAVMAKVVGGHCNLRCTYCYYTDKPTVLHQEHGGMTEEVLEAYIRQNLLVNGSRAVVEFAWHGGEPTLAGIDFFRKALALEKRYGKNRRIVNTLQTNATLLDDEWGAFFARHRFLLGVSVDGPKVWHDTYRTGPEGGSFEKTMRGIEILRRHGVPFNTLTTVNAANASAPREIYDFLREQTDHMQFLPVVEALGTVFEVEEGQSFATPPGVHSAFLPHPVTAFSVTPEGYGEFLCEIFDRWKERDFGKKQVQLFEVTAGHLLGKPSALCVHDALCGHAPTVEANGDVYACDRYAFPSYRLGNLLETPLEELLEQNRRFGMHKAYGLPKECFACPYLKLCFGGCPKDRITFSADGERGKNYLCAGYKRFFRHFLDHMDILLPR